MTKRYVYGISVRGAAHIKNGTECQDSMRIRKLPDEMTVAAAADGHGSRSCPYSGTGSSLAAETFCDIIEELTESFDGDTDALRTYLSREANINIAEKIEQEWKCRVLAEHTASRRQPLLSRMPVVETGEIYRLYGTTLLGILLTPDYIFAFQIGDGDIMLVTGDGAQCVVEAEKLPGVETHSLSSENAWKKAVTAVCPAGSGEGGGRLYILATDGFANSHRTDEEFEKTCVAYLNMIGEHGFEEVSENLEEWLEETSGSGCGDDITVILAYEAEGSSGTLYARKRRRALTKSHAKGRASHRIRRRGASGSISGKWRRAVPRSFGNRT